MSTSFASMKKNRVSEFTKLQSEVQKLSSNQQSNAEDNRFWKPDVDKAGNGYAVIRFLPAPDNESAPYVRVWDHGFQGPGGWYIEKSLTTIGQKDPVSEYNTQLWNSGVEANKELVRKYKRRLSFISNIYVVRDPNHPENEGKVFLFKYGKKIWDKIELAMDPEFEDEQKINPFDFWEGADFKLKIRKVEGYRNYDKSEFEDPSPLLGGDDDVLEGIWRQQHGLQAFIDPKEFKSYDELKTRLNKALGLIGDTQRRATVDSYDDMDEPPRTQRAPTQRTAAEKSAPVAEEAPFDVDDDDNLDFFKRLAEED